jgi:hypothetical protein
MLAAIRPRMPDVRRRARLNQFCFGVGCLLGRKNRKAAGHAGAFQSGTAAQPLVYTGGAGGGALPLP